MRGVRRKKQGTATLYASWVNQRLIETAGSRDAYEIVSKQHGISINSLRYLAYRERWRVLIRDFFPAIWVRRAMQFREVER